MPTVSPLPSPYPHLDSAERKFTTDEGISRFNQIHPALEQLAETGQLSFPLKAEHFERFSSFHEQQYELIYEGGSQPYIHNGLDLTSDLSGTDNGAGTPIYSALNGTVRDIYVGRGEGVTLVIGSDVDNDGTDDIVSIYSHIGLLPDGSDFDVGRDVQRAVNGDRSTYRPAIPPNSPYVTDQNEDGYGDTLTMQNEINGEVYTITLEEGDEVTAGDLVAFIGNTGTASSGPHLHWSLNLVDRNISNNHVEIQHYRAFEDSPSLNPAWLVNMINEDYGQQIEDLIPPAGTPPEQIIVE